MPLFVELRFLGRKLLLNRYAGQNLHQGFESLPLRHQQLTPFRNSLRCRRLWPILWLGRILQDQKSEESQHALPNILNGLLTPTSNILAKQRSKKPLSPGTGGWKSLSHCRQRGARSSSGSSVTEGEFEREKARGALISLALLVLVSIALLTVLVTASSRHRLESSHR